MGAARGHGARAFGRSRHKSPPEGMRKARPPNNNGGNRGELACVTLGVALAFRHHHSECTLPRWALLPQREATPVGLAPFFTGREKMDMANSRYSHRQDPSAGLHEALGFHVVAPAARAPLTELGAVHQAHSLDCFLIDLGSDIPVVEVHQLQRLTIQFLHGLEPAFRIEVALSLRLVPHRPLPGHPGIVPGGLLNDLEGLRYRCPVLEGICPLVPD